MSLPDDADDLRGLYFRELLGKGSTWVLIAIAVVAAAVGGVALAGPAIGAAAAGGALLVALVVVFAIADSRSEEAFFNVYAQQNGLALGGRGPLPYATPLLRKGDDRYAERTLEGALADGVHGRLALYTYEEESTDSEGHRQTSYYRYTVGLVEVSECAEHVPELICQRKFGLELFEGIEDAFRRKRRVEFESTALTDRYEIFCHEGQDENWLRQLFSPAFIVWLTETAPDKFAFEVVNGYLCAYVSGHKKEAAELDAMRAATVAVATRLREEALESAQKPPIS